MVGREESELLGDGCELKNCGPKFKSDNYFLQFIANNSLYPDEKRIVSVRDQLKPQCRRGRSSHSRVVANN